MGREEWAHLSVIREISLKNGMRYVYLQMEFHGYGFIRDRQEALGPLHFEEDIERGAQLRRRFGDEDAICKGLC